MNSVRERSILAAPIAKFGPLREPIRMLLFTLDHAVQPYNKLLLSSGVRRSKNIPFYIFSVQWYLSCFKKEHFEVRRSSPNVTSRWRGDKTVLFEKRLLLRICSSLNISSIRRIVYLKVHLLTSGK